MAKQLKSTLPSEKFQLPLRVTTRDGQIFNPADPWWRLSNGIARAWFNFGSMGITDALQFGLKSVLIWYLENHSIGHASGGFHKFKKLFKFIKQDNEGLVHEINALHLINFRAVKNSRNESDLSGLGAFLKKWFAMSLPGVNKNVPEYFKDVRLKGVVKGEAVRTMDPIKGPFTDLEFQLVHQALRRKYIKGELNLESYSLIWLVIVFGMRPSQYAAMKVCDIWLPDNSQDSDVYIIQIPSAKKAQGPRKVFATRKLDSRVGKMVFEHAQNIQREFADSVDDPSQAPLFPSRKVKGHIDGFDFHIDAQILGKNIANIVRKFGVISERTGKPLNVMATRFRRTLATRMAEEGHSLLSIAEMMDHSDTQNVGVYVESTPGVIENIDRAISTRMAPIAQAFLGRVIRGESEAVSSGELSSHICAPEQTGSFQPMGNCGSFGFCGLAAPIACYTCAQFEPWLDGPHEQVLSYLINERARLMKSTGPRVAMINDLTITAVREAIGLCRKQLGHPDE
jgi:integrase